MSTKIPRLFRSGVKVDNDERKVAGTSHFRQVGGTVLFDQTSGGTGSQGLNVS